MKRRCWMRGQRSRKWHGNTASVCVCVCVCVCERKRIIGLRGSGSVWVEKVRCGAV